MPHAIRTPRLLLRPVLVRDGAQAADALNHHAVLKETMSWGHPSDADHCRRRFALTRSWAPADDTMFALLAEGRVIGTIGLHRRPADRGERTYALGYMLGPGWAGRGYATEAVRALSAFAFRTYRARRIVADVFTDNLASARVLRKAGFTGLGDAGPGWSATRGAHFPRIYFELRREGWTRAITPLKRPA